MELLKRQRDFRSAPYMAVYFYWFNTQVPPLDDVRVRRALNLAIDRQSLVEHVTRAGQLAYADFVPAGLGGYPGLHSPLFDPERARALLREAGYGPEHPLPVLTLRYNTSETHKQLAEALQAMWREQLGARVEIENLEWNVYLKAMHALDFQLARYSWIGDYPDPYTFLEVFSAHNGNNSSGWQDERYEELLRSANRQRDPAQRLALLAQAEERLRDAVPAAPIFVYTRTELIKPYVRGHVINYQGRHLLKYWWIDRRYYGASELPADELDHGFPQQPVAASGGVEAR
jgi:ABC-type oligopeptide transport system substrate-binding subunit